MCGIIGYIGEKNCIPVLINGLKRLEYRGYDSAGIGVFSDDTPYCIKNKGKVAVLDETLQSTNFNAKIGIGHTRWATHGQPNEINAHPHSNSEKTIFSIHNGIIENHNVIRKSLEKSGYKFTSETDSEVIPHLVDSFLKKGYNFFDSVRLALNEVEGTYGIAIIYSGEPDKIIAARKGSPLLIGIGDGENFIASDVSAILAHTKKVVYLEDGELAEVYKDRFCAKNISDDEIKKQIPQYYYYS
jgi:glutamine---fructose-6-phosphate transaminase (isomerizing)